MKFQSPALSFAQALDWMSGKFRNSGLNYDSKQVCKVLERLDLKKICYLEMVLSPAPTLLNRKLFLNDISYPGDILLVEY